MTSTYRFCGDTGILHLSTGDITCSQFGEKVQLTDEQAVTLIASRAPIFSEQDFAKFGFTAADLDENPSASMHHRASADFQKKKAAVVEALVQRIIAAQQKKAVVPLPLADKPFVDIPAVVALPEPMPAPVAADSTPTEEAR